MWLGGGFSMLIHSGRVDAFSVWSGQCRWRRLARACNDAFVESSIVISEADEIPLQALFCDLCLYSWLRAMPHHFALENQGILRPPVSSTYGQLFASMLLGDDVHDDCHVDDCTDTVLLALGRVLQTTSSYGTEYSGGC